MGFLEIGVPLDWEDTEEYHKILDYVIKHGTLQFLRVFNMVKDRKNDVLRWGDEVEYHLYKDTTKDDESKPATSLKLNCIAKELLEKLNAEDAGLEKAGETVLSAWHPEWGAWMIEATPAFPYGENASDLLQLQESLQYRRQRIQRQLGKGEGICLLPSWPRMGCTGFVDGYEKTRGPKASSNYLPDEIINPHPRFGTLVQNIRRRRGRNVEIHMPLFIDEKTAVEPLNRPLAGLPNAAEIETQEEIYMDGMGFGMGCCCLQVTFQARDLKESRHLYDQLAVLCPIFLSLSAGSPIFKGLLAATDCRWDVISQSVDCRTPIEYGTSPITEGSALKRGKMKIRKSRYASVDLFLSDSPLLTDNYETYNDVNTEINEDTFKVLVENGVDEVLARHVAHLFIRDPLVIFGDRVDVDDSKTTEHFENIQSTNWQTMRWKPPPASALESSDPKTAIGWRVEFRPMEVQLTDFENAAYTIVIVLLSRVILFFDLNLYIPISKVDENMDRAHKMDSVLEEKFYFRRNLVPLESECLDTGVLDSKDNAGDDLEDYMEEMTILEILQGKGEKFPGLFPLIYAYLDIIDCDSKTYAVLDNYMKFLLLRSQGKVKTLARWTRDFVASHPDYDNDSRISATVERDLVLRCSDITNGKVHDATLLGPKAMAHASEKAVEVPEEPITGEVGDGRRLRGASFSEQFLESSVKDRTSECQVVLDLIERYRTKKQDFVVSEAAGFSSTPAFLSR